MKRIALSIVVVVALLFLFACTNPKTNNFEPRTQSGTFEPRFDLTKISKPSGYSIIFGELKEGEYTEGKILVGYEDRKAVDQIVKALNGTIVREIPQIKVVSIKFNGKVADAYKKIRSLDIKGIRYVEPSYKRELIKPTRVERNPELYSKSKIGLMNGRDYGEELSNELWGHEAIGITQDLWEEASGTGIIVAVVDSGVDGTHPDLQGQVVKGYRPYFDQELPAGTDSSYGGAHGTHVAGTIAAKKDGKGIVGVAPGAKIMPIVIFDTDLNGDDRIGDYVGDDAVAAGIIWAVDNGAKVMNHSWGGWGYSHTMKAAFDYALERNVIMVCSAGNNHSDSHHQYPANYPGVIQVAAVEYNGGDYRTANFSSRSDMVTIGAPGVTILSTVPGPTSIGYEGHNRNVRATNGGTYDYYQGTSMAAPHVTGAVAVLLQNFPNAKAWQIRKLIEDTAQDIDKSGWDNDSGAGLLKLNNALSGELPTTGGLEKLEIVVTDASGEFGVPTMFVQLVDPNTKRLLAAKTDLEGVAKFYQVDDPSSWQVYIGGPDHMERALAPIDGSSDIGNWAISLRMEEERQVYKEQLSQLEPAGENRYQVKLSSEFKCKFSTQLSGATFVVTDPELKKVYYSQPYVKDQDIELYGLSGQVTLGVLLLSPAANDITIQGTVMLNGHEIPVSGTIKKGSTFAVVDDFGGYNFGTPENPLYAWWTVFGTPD
ncbi:S8 family serine peptidase [Fervidobacterium thailandense]|uniref:Peptidase S8 n=1 Tax=Fervidobacterium thailandense TaxID=1008305 RepID=A0A1E3G284_9BACT|nr:S8 family serine peptidase [Fervidobacterium thailandense]ODN29758.1 peptidase S8 [Fervidobacterium thailandense]